MEAKETSGIQQKLLVPILSVDQYIGGNFWAKPDGTGFSQTATDADGDGIADTAYKLSGNNNYTDFLPLVGGGEPKQPLVPPLKTSVPGQSSETRIAANKVPKRKSKITTRRKEKTDCQRDGNKINRN